jgi:cellulose synthase/poly-beta-1,6-N-acetylglucosamine synthase-like glycosyltransferase
VNLTATDKSVSIVVPMHNASRTVEGLIHSLVNQDYPKERYEIILVDDCSTDETQRLVSNLTKNSEVAIKTLTLEKDMGQAAARNHGIKNAQNEIIAFTDADTVPDKEWLKNLVEEFGSEEIAGVRGRTVTDGYELPTIRVAPTSGYITCNIAYRRDVLLEVDLFDEKFRCGEDSDLAHRILERGYEIQDAPKAIVCHPLKNRSTWQICKYAALHQYDALFYQRHPKAIKTYMTRIAWGTMSPLSSVLGLSIAGITLISYLAVAVILGIVYGLLFALTVAVIIAATFCVFSTAFFVLYGYRFINSGQKIEIQVRLKIAIASLVYLVVAMLARMYGSMKYRTIMV